jgi:uncharacterized membrane protein
MTRILLRWGGPIGHAQKEMAVFSERMTKWLPKIDSAFAMVWQLGTTKEPIADRKVIGVGLVMIGLAIIGTVVFFVGDLRLRQVVVTSASPPVANWFLVVAVAVAGFLVVAAGIRLLQPKTGVILITAGVVVTLVGVFEYWWDEMFIALDGYPNVNWAATIPMTVVGLVLLAAGIRRYSRG